MDMKWKRNKDKSITVSKFWTGSIIAALIASVTLFVVMLEIEKNQMEQYEKGSVYVASGEIPKGQLLTEDNYMEYLETKEMDLALIPESAILSESLIQGLIAGIDIEEGVFLSKGMFTEVNTITASMDNPVIAGCKADDLYQIVGGVLRAGDRVHIYRVDGEGNTSLLWPDIFVQAAFDQSGMEIAGGDKTTAAQRINVYMDATDVEPFYTGLATGSLRIVKVCE